MDSPANNQSQTSNGPLPTTKSQSSTPWSDHRTDPIHITIAPDNPVLTNSKKETIRLDDPSKKRISFKFLLILLLLLSILGGGGWGGYLYYQYNYSPEAIIAKALDQLDKSDSFTVLADLENNTYTDVSALFDYHKSTLKLSRLQLKFKNIEGELGEDIVFLIMTNEFDTYLKLTYSKFEEFNQGLTLALPFVTELELYKTLVPVVEGDAWIHISQEYLDNLSDNSQENGEVIISEAQAEDLGTKLYDSMIISNFDRNATHDGKDMYMAAIGFDEDKLVLLIESFKDLNIEISIKDLNNLIDVVKSADNWDSDIIKLYIDKETNNLRFVSFASPNFSEEEIAKSLEETVQEKSSLSTFQGFLKNAIDNLDKKDETNELQAFLNLELKNYNAAPEGEKPSMLVEVQEITQAFDKDLPIFTELFLGSLGSTSSGILPTPESQVFGWQDIIEDLPKQN